MFKLLFRTFFLWRRNDASSIAFKTVFFACLAAIVVAPFTSDRNTLIAAAAAALVSLLRYGLQYWRERAKLLEHLGGDKRKLAALRRKFKENRAGGALIMEMLRAEMDEANEYDEAEEAPTEEQCEANRAASRASLDRLLAAVDAVEGVSIPDRDARVAELEADFADGEYARETSGMLTTLFEERAVSFGMEDYVDDGDHAALVELVAQASLGAWAPAECESTFDEAREKCTVRFVDEGREHIWRFNQTSDWVSGNFLSKLLAYAQERSGLEVVVIESEEFFEGVLLPRDLCARLASEPAREAA